MAIKCGVDGPPELLLEADGLAHQLAQLLLELRGPQLGALVDEVEEEAAEDLDVVGLVAQRVAEHRADARQLALAARCGRPSELLHAA